MSSQTRRIVDIDDHEFNPFFADEVVFGDTEDPYPKLAEMLREKSVHPGAYRNFFTTQPDISLDRFRHYTVLGYTAVQQVLANPQIFTNEVFRHNLLYSFGETITVMDAPHHPRYRRIFQKAFLPQVVRQWSESLVQPVIDELMRQFDGRHTADLIQEFTIQYPFRIIYKQLELPPEDVKIFHKLAVMLGLYLVDMEHATQASERLGRYYRDLIASRRESPDDGMVSVLATAEVDGERIPDEILVSFLRQLVNAAGDTTYRGTSILLTCLLRHPEQLAAVYADRTLVPKAIDEALRWDPPVTSTWRYVSADAEIDGHPVQAGSIVNVVLGSANRDAQRYPNPDEFNIFRTTPPAHLAFASGPHVCIGQHLARLEMTRALNTLLDQLPNLRLDPDRPPPDVRGFLLRAPKHLYVRYD